MDEIRRPGGFATGKTGLKSKDGTRVYCPFANKPQQKAYTSNLSYAKNGDHFKSNSNVRNLHLNKRKWYQPW
jgi:5,10-methylene-tetrahydrofolate dehydrogenase/methenyl tetrahydrofolate cyclohydrolase